MKKNILDIRPVAEANGESLSLIRLPLPQPGFDEFLGSWLLRSAEGVTLVDCGVTGTYSALKKALDDLGVKPNLLLLTHVHLDHSGASGCLARDFPEMKIFAFERAAKHLIAPEKLWVATAATLGEAMAAAYQAPLPVPPDRVISREALPAAWTVLDTPGHATHHVSYIQDFAGHRVCFGGEALGCVPGSDITSWFADDVRHDGIRPATPPKYVPEIGRASMKKLADADWDLFCGGHYGAAADRTLPARALAQNELWEKHITQALADGLSEGEMVDLMLREDPELGSLAFCDQPNRDREIYFLGNSVRGFARFLQERASGK